jgi:hypothetical protein
MLRLLRQFLCERREAILDSESIVYAYAFLT